MPRDVSNNVDERFDPLSLAVGQNVGLAPGLQLTVEVGVLGDIDGDGIVGVPDLLVLLASWGACPTCSSFWSTGAE